MDTSDPNFDLRLYDQWAEARHELGRGVSFPRQFLDMGDFRELVAADVDADGLCGMGHVTAGQVFICTDRKDHPEGCFGTWLLSQTKGLEPPGLEPTD
jgi:hypothetical protein